MFLEFALAFLIGSIPTGFWYAKFFHNLDIRQHGSGNIGATNSYRVIGKKAAIIVLFIDLLKGLIPVLLAKYLDFSSENVLLAGVFAVLGHLFSPFLNFRGGKGIATAFGVILGFSPLAALCAVLVFGAVLYFSKMVSLGSIFGVLTFWIYILITKVMGPLWWISTVLAILLIVSHRKNISRIIQGKESKI